MHIWNRDVLWLSVRNEWGWFDAFVYVLGIKLTALYTFVPRFFGSIKSPLRIDVTLLRSRRRILCVNRGGFTFFCSPCLSYDVLQERTLGMQSDDDSFGIQETQIGTVTIDDRTTHEFVRHSATENDSCIHASIVP
jgi:hypothetical protein